VGAGCTPDTWKEQNIQLAGAVFYPLIITHVASCTHAQHTPRGLRLQQKHVFFGLRSSSANSQKDLQIKRQKNGPVCAGDVNLPQQCSLRKMGTCSDFCTLPDNISRPNKKAGLMNGLLTP